VHHQCTSRKRCRLLIHITFTFHIALHCSQQQAAESGATAHLSEPELGSNAIMLEMVKPHNNLQSEGVAEGTNVHAKN